MSVLLAVAVAKIMTPQDVVGWVNQKMDGVWGLPLMVYEEGLSSSTRKLWLMSAARRG